jgi:hypothetical protein
MWSHPHKSQWVIWAVRDEHIHDIFKGEFILDFLTLVLDTEDHLSIKHHKNGMTSSHPSSSLLIHRTKHTLSAERGLHLGVFGWLHMHNQVRACMHMFVCLHLNRVHYMQVTTLFGWMHPLPQLAARMQRLPPRQATRIREFGLRSYRARGSA